MENAKMIEEELKAKKYYERLYNKSIKKTGVYAVIWIMVFLSVITYMMPAQFFLDSEATGESPLLMPAMLTIYSFVIVSMRATLFREYVEGQKARRMVEILKYHPISKRAMWKEKIKAHLSFMGKLTAVALVLQSVITLFAFKELSWINFVYILLCVFVIPMIIEIVVDLITGDIFQE